jgi:hypothetical protein
MSHGLGLIVGAVLLSAAFYGMSASDSSISHGTLCESKTFTVTDGRARCS